MTKVLTFGTFDHFHKGHHHYLASAAKHGDQLYVVIARDQTVQKIKGFLPDHNELERQKQVQAFPIVTEAILGSLTNKYSVLEKIKPDIICLGYDQQSFNHNLDKAIKDLNLKTKVIRLEAFKPEQFKSSILRKSSKLDSSN